MGPDAVGFVQCKSGPEYPGRQDLCHNPTNFRASGRSCISRGLSQGCSPFAPGAPADGCFALVLFVARATNKQRLGRG